MTEFDENIKAKRIITLNLPVQVWCVILQNVKLQILQFDMTFMINLSIVVILNIVKWIRTVLTRLFQATASKKLSYTNHGLYNFCADVDIEEDNFTHWLQCCDKNNLYDTKTPEVFKTEFFLATKWQVCSKTYVINKTTPVNVRMEMKAYQLLRKARGNPQSNDQELFATQNHLQRYIGVWFTHRFHFQTCHENLEFS